MLGGRVTFQKPGCTSGADSPGLLGQSYQPVGPDPPTCPIWGISSKEGLVSTMGVSFWAKEKVGSIIATLIRSSFLVENIIRFLILISRTLGTWLQISAIMRSFGILICQLTIFNGKEHLSMFSRRFRRQSSVLPHWDGYRLRGSVSGRPQHPPGGTVSGRLCWQMPVQGKHP